MVPLDGSFHRRRFPDHAGSRLETFAGLHGSAPGSLTSVAEDDDDGGIFTSLRTFNCEQGTNYQIVVAVSSSRCTWCLGAFPRPDRFLPGPGGRIQCRCDRIR